MALWDDIVRTFFPWARKKEAAKSKGGGASPDLKELKQPLSIGVERQKQHKVMQFQVTEMALNAFVFETKSQVIKGEMLIAEFNLPGLGLTKLTGTVDWVLAGGNSHTGQLNIWTSPEQRAALNQLIRTLRRY